MKTNQKSDSPTDQFSVKPSRILASQADADIFFKALENPPKPNNNLMASAQAYKKLVGL